MTQISNACLNDNILKEFARDKDGTQLLCVMVKEKKHFLRRSLLSNDSQFIQIAQDMVWIESPCLPPRIFWQERFLLEECIEGQSLREWRIANQHLDDVWVMEQFYHMLNLLKIMQRNKLCHGNISLDSCIIHAESNSIICCHSHPCKLSPEAKKKDILSVLHIFYFILTGNAYQKKHDIEKLDSLRNIEHFPKNFITMLKSMLQDDKDRYAYIDLLQSIDDHLNISVKYGNTDSKQNKNTPTLKKQHIHQALKFVMVLVISIICSMIAFIKWTSNSSTIAKARPKSDLIQEKQIEEKEKLAIIPIATFKNQLFDDVPIPVLLKIHPEDTTPHNSELDDREKSRLPPINKLFSP